MGNTLVHDTAVVAVGSNVDESSASHRPARSRRAKSLAAVFASLLALTALVGFARPADASPDAPDAPRVASAPDVAAVPSCVWTYLDDSGSTDYLEVHNDCSYSVRVKVVLAFATDFPCYTIGSGSYRWYTWGWPGRFDGLADC
jgi:hypothetical protein